MTFSTSHQISSTLCPAIVAIVVACFPALVASATDLPTIKAQESSRCANEPGSTPARRIVTQQYYNVVKASRGDAAVASFQLNTTKHRIKNGCPIYFGMMQHESIFVDMIREEDNSILLSEWEHDSTFTIAYMRFTADRSWWESGKSWNHRQFRLQGQSTWTTIDKRLFFLDHNWRQNYGSSNPMEVELTSEYGGAGTGVEFSGLWKFTFHVASTKMTESNYQAIKDLFMTNCAPYRGGRRYNETFFHSVSSERYDSEEWGNLDTLEGCSWQDWGWWMNETEGQETEYEGFCGSRIWDVYCDHAGNVIMLLLGSQNLQGGLTSKLADLTKLQYVDLRFNQLAGRIPTSWYNHPTLHHLDLEHNQFTGSLPCFTSKNLDVLRVNTNFLTGEFPTCMKQLTKLQVLDVSANDMHGTLPDDFNQLTDMQWLYLEENHFGGSLPASICSLTKLTRLNLKTNKISGQFPAACLNPKDSKGWSKLEYLNVAFNRMTGSIPTLGKLNALTTVVMSHNYFEGTVTEQFDNLLLNHRGSFTQIIASGNMLSGPFPQIIYNMTFLPLGVDSFTFVDNLFRCEKNGRYPEWTIRATSATFGTCTPVPNPKKVDPAQGQSGDSITVEADDIMPGARPSCKFTQGARSATAAGNVITSSTDATKKMIQCFVPTALSQSEGAFQVTVANYGMDYASNDLVMNFNPPTFQVVRAQVVTEGVRITSSVELQGVRNDFDEPMFREMIVDILDSTIPANAITTSWDPFPTPAPQVQAGRRLQATAFTVYFAITLPLDAEAAETKAKVQDIESKLAKSAVVQEAMMNYGFTAAAGQSYALTTVDHPIHDSVTLAGESSNSESTDIVPGLIGAIIGAVLIGAFCCCICFIRYREKKGMPYFADSLDEGNTAVPKASAPPVGVVAGGGGGEETGANYGNNDV